MEIKIGVFIDEFNKLPNWQLRVIHGLLDAPGVKLTVLIQKDKIPFNTPINDPFFSLVPKIVFWIQNQIEKLFFSKSEVGLDKKSLLKSLYKVPTLKLAFSKKNHHYYLNPHCTKQFENHELDMVVKLIDDDVSTVILESLQYKVWELVHTSFLSSKRGPVGFWEVLKKMEGTSCQLIQLLPDKDKCNKIDNAFFNRSWSMLETANIAKEGSVSLLFKNLKKLVNGNLVVPTDQYDIPRYSTPSLSNILSYYNRFYFSLFNKIILKIGAKYLGWRPECWTIFLGTGDFMQSGHSDFEPLPMPKDEFWADPFLFRYNKIDFLFFENYSYKTKKAKISCGIIKDMKLTNVVDVLDLDYHLSFPYVFEEEGEIYLMPETSENNRLELYRAVSFPIEWELHATAFEGESVADPFFYDDDNGQKWLFINKKSAETAPLNSELYLYKIASLSLKEITPHKQNPVIIDARVARNGGSLFVRENNLYRPSQRNIDGVYGRALNINQIHQLTLEKYAEETVEVLEPTFDNGLMAIHHLHQTKDLFVFDAAYWRK